MIIPDCRWKGHNLFVFVEALCLLFEEDGVKSTTVLAVTSVDGDTNCLGILRTGCGPFDIPVGPNSSHESERSYEHENSDSSGLLPFALLRSGRRTENGVGELGGILNGKQNSVITLRYQYAHRSTLCKGKRSRATMMCDLFCFD